MSNAISLEMENGGRVRVEFRRLPQGVIVVIGCNDGGETQAMTLSLPAARVLLQALELGLLDDGHRWQGYRA